MMRNIIIFLLEFFIVWNIRFLLISVWFSIVAACHTPHCNTAESWHFMTLKSITSKYIIHQIVTVVLIFFLYPISPSSLKFSKPSSSGSFFFLRCVTKFFVFFFRNLFILRINTHENKDFSAQELFNQLTSYLAHNICNQFISYLAYNIFNLFYLIPKCFNCFFLQHFFVGY